MIKAKDNSKGKEAQPHSEAKEVATKAKETEAKTKEVDTKAKDTCVSQPS